MWYSSRRKRRMDKAKQAPFRRDVTRSSGVVCAQLRNKPVGTLAVPVGRAADALLCIVECVLGFICLALTCGYISAASSILYDLAVQDRLLQPFYQGHSQGTSTNIKQIQFTASVPQTSQQAQSGHRVSLRRNTTVSTHPWPRTLFLHIVKPFAGADGLISAAGHSHDDANVIGMAVPRSGWSENNRGTKASRDHRQPRLLGRANAQQSGTTAVARA